MASLWRISPGFMAVNSLIIFTNKVIPHTQNPDMFCVIVDGIIPIIALPAMDYLE